MPSSARPLAAVVIITTGFDRADPIASLVVAALMVHASFGVLLRDPSRVLLEMSPTQLSPDEIGQTMAAYPGVAEVHDRHVLEVTSGMPSLSAHVLVEPACDCHQARRELEHLVDEQCEHHTHDIAGRPRPPRRPAVVQLSPPSPRRLPQP